MMSSHNCLNANNKFIETIFEPKLFYFIHTDILKPDADLTFVSLEIIIIFFKTVSTQLQGIR